jgi:hypothetical protein
VNKYYHATKMLILFKIKWMEGKIIQQTALPVMTECTTNTMQCLTNKQTNLYFHLTISYAWLMYYGGREAQV